MRFTSISCEQREAMLRTVGCADMDALFDSVPAAVRLSRPLDVPDGLTEFEADSRLRALARANAPATSLVSFAGAGCYDHHIPSIVDHVLRKPEFFTAYTPYQPEVSQGTLQNIYEFQTMICELTGMDVANASMYDGATALTEAALMAARVTKRHTVVVSAAVHPEWRQVLRTYADASVLEVREVASAGGVTDGAALAAALDDSVAAVLIASPNFFGALEDLGAIAEAAHAAGALFVVAANPVLLGVLEPPSAFGADIVVGEGQMLGNAMSFGGPGLGFFGAREAHLRQMPGRIVGRTVDVDGSMAFVLTMQTREQHIRREKATSNICSNHALNALAATVYLSALGVAGLESVGRSCVAKAHYLRAALLSTGRFASPWESAFANEFALSFDGDAVALRDALVERGFLAGVPVRELDPCAPAGLMLFAATEKRTKAEMDALADEVTSL
ncbi:MAG: aminomethyl-transferring glycine dehydrogenase subunit GcvPA [Coriobacteriia bacterium]|nr:aminomethyl-transferring glycine dehydrogenase subunit GcvPA [Coriobacteriia bacterium]